jgi:hypothetical protein
MKKRRKPKKLLIVIIILLLAVAGFFTYKAIFHKEEVKEVKVVGEIPKYGYVLKETKTAKYKDMFYELKDILEADKVDQEKYVKKITEMFIYDFYSLNDKAAKTDVGGTDFVYSKILENFMLNAEDTYYKYVESNIYNNRNQKLPEVSKITIDSVKQEPFKYENVTDNEAYHVKVTWEYKGTDFSEYQREATLVFVHDGIKLVLVELQ